MPIVGNVADMGNKKKNENHPEYHLEIISAAFWCISSQHFVCMGSYGKQFYIFHPLNIIL